VDVVRNADLARTSVVEIDLTLPQDIRFNISTPGEQL
jgi:hypothetical protein